MSERLRVLVVGAGYMGRAHARVVREISRELEADLVGIVDRDPHAARRASNAFGVPGYTELDRALAETRPSVAIVATPTRTHIDVAEKLLEAGVERLLIEKPLDSDFDKAEAFAERWRSRSGDIMVGYIERFNPAYRLALEEVSSGSLGRLLTLYARRVGPFTTRVMDVGVTLDLATHELDLLYNMTQAEPRVLDAYVRRVYSENAEDLALATLEARGFRATIEVNRVTAYKERRWILTGDKAVLQVDFMRQKVSLHRPRWQSESTQEWREPLLLEDRAFLEATLTGEPVPVPLEEAMVSLRLARQIIEKATRVQGS